MSRTLFDNIVDRGLEKTKERVQGDTLMQDRSAQLHHDVSDNQISTQVPTNSVSFAYRLYALLQVSYDTLLSKLFHHHVPTESTIDCIDETRQAHWDQFQFETDNALDNHLKSFGYVDENGEIQISDFSIYTAMQKDFNMTAQEAETGAVTGIAVPKLNNADHVHSTLFGLQGHFAPKDGVLFMHPSDTGFYEKGTGKFLKERFDKLQDYAVLGANNKFVIAESRFYDCINQLAADDHRWDEADIVYKKLGKIGHDGEFKQLFSLMNKLGFETIDGVSHYELDNIEEFYRNTAKTMHRIRQKISLAEEKQQVVQLKATSQPSKEQLDNQPAPDSFDRLLNTATTYAKGVVTDCPNFFFDHRYQKALVAQGITVTDTECRVSNNSSLPMIGSGPVLKMLK